MDPNWVIESLNPKIRPLRRSFQPRLLCPSHPFVNDLPGENEASPAEHLQEVGEFDTKKGKNFILS